MIITWLANLSSEFVNMEIRPKNLNNTDILRVRKELAALREYTNSGFDALEAMIAALEPSHDAVARYQRTRLICSSNRRTREYLEGRIK